MGEEIGNKESEVFIKEASRNAMVVKSDLFGQLSQLYLTEMPIAGAAAFRTKSGKSGILINWDYYKNHLRSGENFTDCIDFEIAHEAFELWETRNEPGEVDAFGPAHYEAIKFAMREAQKDGKLDRYMKLKKNQFQFFDKHGDPKAMEELKFYEGYEKEISES